MVRHDERFGPPAEIAGAVDQQLRPALHLFVRRLGDAEDMGEDARGDRLQECGAPLQGQGAVAVHHQRDQRQVAVGGEEQQAEQQIEPLADHAGGAEAHVPRGPQHSRDGVGA